MVLIGRVSQMFGLSNDFYCGPYSFFGKAILGLSLVYFLYLILPNLQELIMSLKRKLI